MRNRKIRNLNRFENINLGDCAKSRQSEAEQECGLSQVKLSLSKAECKIFKEDHLFSTSKQIA